MFVNDKYVCVKLYENMSCEYRVRLLYGLIKMYLVVWYWI